MRRLYPQLRDEWRCDAVGFIVESDDTDDLSEDMLEVSLPNGILVCAGWFDDRYAISVTHDLRQLIPSVPARDADEAIRIVEEMVRQYRHALVSRTTSTF